MQSISEAGNYRPGHVLEWVHFNRKQVQTEEELVIYWRGHHGSVLIWLLVVIKARITNQWRKKKDEEEWYLQARIATTSQHHSCHIPLIFFCKAACSKNWETRYCWCSSPVVSNFGGREKQNNHIICLLGGDVLLVMHTPWQVNGKNLTIVLPAGNTIALYDTNFEMFRVSPNIYLEF